MYTLMKKTMIALASLVLLAAGSMAQAQQDHPAQVTVKEIVTNVTTYLKDNLSGIQGDPSILYDRVEEIIVPHVDFETMTRLAVGKSWRDADATQRTELVEEFERLLLNSYASALLLYENEEIEFERFRAGKKPDRVEIRTLFMSVPSPIPAIYKMRDKNKDGDWLIYDIDVSGLSLVGNFRTKFTDEINKGGIDGLLTFLKDRNLKSGNN